MGVGWSVNSRKYPFLILAVLHSSHCSTGSGVGSCGNKIDTLFLRKSIKLYNIMLIKMGPNTLLHTLGHPWHLDEAVMKIPIGSRLSLDSCLCVPV